MTTSSLNIPADELLQLYRGAHELSYRVFQQLALGLIESVLKVDAAVWGSGELTRDPLAIHSASKHRVDLEPLPVWAVINRRDKVVAIGGDNQCRTVAPHAPTPFAAPQDEAMLEYTRRFGRQSCLVPRTPRGLTGESDWLSLYRPDPDAHYSEFERLVCEAWMPHLCEALRINRAINEFSVELGVSDQTLGAIAIASADGRLRYAQTRCLELMQEEWSQIGDGLLPAESMPVRQGRAELDYLGRYLRLRARHFGDVVFIEVRARRELDELPQRRGEIASLFASGYSSKEIARQLRLSPSTVRNQLKAVYRTLNISSRSELIELAKGGGPKGSRAQVIRKGGEVPQRNRNRATTIVGHR